MYIDSIFVYMILIIFSVMGYLLWKNERRVSKLEVVVSLMTEHGKNTDISLKSTMEILEEVLQNIIKASKSMGDAVGEPNEK